MFTIAKRKKPGFTLVELLVAMLVSGILIAITTSVYMLFRRSMTQDQSRADITQNARIVLDRLSRELRQTPFIVTELPSSPADTSIAQPGEIEFEDGHSEPGEANYLSYRHYFVAQGVLKLETKEYYFATNPTQRVRQTDVGAGGVKPTARILTVPAQEIAENVQSISFWGASAIQIQLITQDGNGQTYPLRTVVYGRNL